MEILFPTPSAEDKTSKNLSCLIGRRNNKTYCSPFQIWLGILVRRKTYWFILNPQRPDRGTWWIPSGEKQIQNNIPGAHFSEERHPQLHAWRNWTFTGFYDIAADWRRCLYTWPRPCWLFIAVLIGIADFSYRFIIFIYIFINPIYRVFLSTKNNSSFSYYFIFQDIHP